MSAREALHGTRVISMPEILLVLALVYAVLMAALHGHAVHLPAVMTILPY